MNCKALADKGLVVLYAVVIILTLKEENIYFRKTSSNPWSELELSYRGSKNQGDRITLTPGKVSFKLAGKDNIQG